MSTTTVKIASNNKPLERGTIAGFDGYWYNHQGYVVDPNSSMEDEGFCVAVFFGPEVTYGRFNFSPSQIQEWDHKYREEIKSGDWRFLFEKKIYEKCPRVVCFRPEDVIVQDGWKIETLVDRLFKNRYHRILSLSEKYPSEPEKYQCFLKECTEQASRMALFNVWGTVYQLYVCEKCFPKANGICADDLPETKKPLLFADGTPVT